MNGSRYTCEPEQSGRSRIEWLKIGGASGRRSTCFQPDGPHCDRRLGAGSVKESTSEHGWKLHYNGRVHKGVLLAIAAGVFATMLNFALIAVDAPGAGGRTRRNSARLCQQRRLVRLAAGRLRGKRLILWIPVLQEWELVELRRQGSVAERWSGCLRCSREAVRESLTLGRLGTDSEHGHHGRQSDGTDNTRVAGCRWPVSRADDNRTGMCCSQG